MLNIRPTNREKGTTNLQRGTSIVTEGVHPQAWQIKGTKEFHSNKEQLKVRRTELNFEAGIVESEVPAAKWPFKITKGPGHPNVGTKSH